MAPSDERLIDCHTHVGVDLFFYLNGHVPYGIDFRSLVEQARRYGIERVLAFPGVSYFGWEGLDLLPPRRSTDDFSVPYAFENRRMMSEIFEINEEYAHAAIPFVIVDPARHQKAQVDSLRKLRQKFPICGFKIQGTVIEAPVGHLAGSGRCLVDLAEEWDVPFIIHSSIAPEDQWSQTSTILDVAESAPKVRFCLAHSCRFDLPSLQRLGQLSNTWVDCSAHGIHCDAAVNNLKVVAEAERRLPSDYTRPEQVMKDLCELLPDRLMWGSDAPFYSYAALHDGKPLALFSTYEKEVDALSLLSTPQRMDVMRNNALRFLGA